MASFTQLLVSFSVGEKRLSVSAPPTLGLFHASTEALKLSAPGDVTLKLSICFAFSLPMTFLRSFGFQVTPAFIADFVCCCGGEENMESSMLLLIPLDLRF